MTRVPLQDRSTGKVIYAEARENLTFGEITTANREWVRFRRKSLSNQQPDTDHWDWTEKILQAREPMSTVGLWLDSRLEALMMLRARPEWTRQGGRSLYIEYIETAPWNQAKYVGQKAKYAGAGLGLLFIATHISREQGWGGALSLLSLPSAMDFYASRGFVDFGADPSQNGLHYMELNADHAAMLMEGGTR